MKQIKTLCLLALLAAFATGCASNNGYSKNPPPCDSFAASFNGDDNPCGPKRKINTNWSWN